MCNTIKTLFIFFVIVILSTIPTGAAYASPVVSGQIFDLETSHTSSFSASTLSFMLRDVSDDLITSPFFDVPHIIPGDSQTKSIRIKKGGVEDFKYTISFSKISGDDPICSVLQLEAKLDSITKYSGALASFSLTPSITISSSGSDDWELTIWLADDSATLINKSCSFDLTVKGWQTNSDGTWGFIDSHSITNTITTGTWEDLVVVDDQEVSELPVIDDASSAELTESAELSPAVLGVDSSSDPTLPPGEPEQILTPTPVQQEDSSSPSEESESVDSPLTTPEVKSEGS